MSLQLYYFIVETLSGQYNLVKINIISVWQVHVVLLVGVNIYNLNSFNILVHCFFSILNVLMIKAINYACFQDWL